jgi:hypothetical protein
MRTNRLGALACAWIVAAGAASIAAGQAPVRRDAELLKQKIASINRRAAVPAVERASTIVSEQEVNAYLAFDAGDMLPAGVVDPGVSMLGTDRVTARAVVDLDRVREQRTSGGLLDPLRYLRGRLMVKATGTLRARDGVARLELESADIAGVPIPTFVLQQIVSYYSRSAAHPSGISLDDPMDLPARIREIQVKPGQAIVVQ